MRTKISPAQSEAERLLGRYGSREKAAKKAEEHLEFHTKHDRFKAMEHWQDVIEFVQTLQA